MMCLRKFLLFLILLPFPTAPPLVMIFVIALMWIKLKPCVYCSVLLVVVFASSCNTGFLSLSFPDAQTPYWISDYTGVNSTATNVSIPVSSLPPHVNATDELVYSAPVPNRCWCDLNRGRLLRPVLMGYRYLDDAETLRKVKRDLKRWRAAGNQDPRSRSVAGDKAEEVTSWARILDAMSTTPQTQQPPLHAAHSWRKYLPFSTKNVPLQEASRTTDGAFDPQVPADPSRHEEESDPLMEWDGTGPVPTTHTTSLPQNQNQNPHPTAQPRHSVFSSSYWWSYLLAQRYLDARVHGIGMVLDFGLTRSEEDVRREIWEIVDWEERRAASRGDDAGEKEEEEQDDEEAGMVEASDWSSSSSSRLVDGADTPKMTTTTTPTPHTRQPGQILQKQPPPQEFQATIETSTAVVQPTTLPVQAKRRWPWMGDRRTGPNAVDEL